MTLLDYQLDDVRRALKVYERKSSEYDGRYERAELVRLIKLVVEIAFNRKFNQGRPSNIQYYVLGDRGKYYPVTEDDINNSYT